MSRLSAAIRRVEFARKYTLAKLATINEADWFLMPSEGVTHIGWQVGHLAMADYLLLLERIRGERSDDERLIAPRFLEIFGRGSRPTPAADDYPPPGEILEVLDRVRAAAVAELHNLADEELDNRPAIPHRHFRTKLGAIHWCADHEMMHAGQIGLLYRLLGRDFDW